jgi:hypothetical protein
MPRIQGDLARGVRSRSAEGPVLVSRRIRVHRKPYPCPGRPPKCRGGARRAQRRPSSRMVAADHPRSKTIRAAIGRCASRVPQASLAGPHEWTGHLKFVPGGAGTRLPGWSLHTTPPQNPMARGRPVRAPSAIGESGWASRVDRASQICTRGAGRRFRHFGAGHRISFCSIRSPVGPRRPGRHGEVGGVLVPILG